MTLLPDTLIWDRSDFVLRSGVPCIAPREGAIRVRPKRATSRRVNPAHSPVEEWRQYKVESEADSGFPAW